MRHVIVILRRVHSLCTSSLWMQTSSTILLSVVIVMWSLDPHLSGKASLPSIRTRSKQIGRLMKSSVFNWVIAKTTQVMAEVEALAAKIKEAQRIDLALQETVFASQPKKKAKR